MAWPWNCVVVFLKSILWKIRSHAETPCVQVSSWFISLFKRYRRKKQVHARLKPIVNWMNTAEFARTKTNTIAYLTKQMYCFHFIARYAALSNSAALYLYRMCAPPPKLAGKRCSCLDKMRAIQCFLFTLRGVFIRESVFSYVYFNAKHRCVYGGN